MAGFFISFEGSEGCGKSTQIRLLMDKAHAVGISPVLVREPGGTIIGEKIRHLLQHDPEASAMCPEAELLLFAASRAQLVREVIAPALQADKLVIADRFLDSTTVYQGVGRAIPADIVSRINRFAAGNRLPDLTFILDMDSAMAIRRLEEGRGEGTPKDRMENQPLEFFEAVRRGYLELAEKEPARVRVLDASRPPEIIFHHILESLAETRHALVSRFRS